MRRKKKEVYTPKPMTEGKRSIIEGLLREYDIESAEDIQDALKDLVSGALQSMLEWRRRWIIILAMIDMSYQKSPIIEMEQNPKL